MTRDDLQEALDKYKSKRNANAAGDLSKAVEAYLATGNIDITKQLANYAYHEAAWNVLYKDKLCALMGKDEDKIFDNATLWEIELNDSGEAHNMIEMKVARGDVPVGMLEFRGMIKDD